MLKFPEGFLWGSATAAHHVEGHNINSDWWDWEQVPGHIRNGDRSTVACDWWEGERYREDFDLAQSLHQNAHRLSIEWSRIEPREGEWSGEAIAFYRRVLTALRERGMTPLVTLYHYTNPRWLVEKGGWETEAVVPLFERFACKAVEELGDLCDFWVTVNEPTGCFLTGYLYGVWPPGKQSFGLAMRVARNMLQAHAAAYRAIHRQQPDALVGIAHSMRPLYPENPRSRLNRFLASRIHGLYNHLFFLPLTDGRLRFPMALGTRLPELIGTQDYIGLNYYFSHRLAVDLKSPTLLFARAVPPRPWGTSFDDELAAWFGHGDLDPDGFYDMTMWCAQFGKPIYITENGICDATDEIRPRYLITSLLALHRAIADGAPVKGYFHWTLVDNFEWKEGYSLRFGLIANDLATQRRTLRPSAEIYSRIACDNGIPEDLIAKYGDESTVDSQQSTVDSR